MTDAWHWWSMALANQKDIGKPPLTITTEPQQGFYKTKYKNGPWEPVAIWKEGDKWIALRSGKSVDADAIWTWCCRNPISAEAYEQAVAGRGWDDDDPTVAAAMGGPGHNVGNITDFEILKSEIESAEAGIDSYKGISTDEQAGRAQSLRARLNELAGQADKLREGLKKPHLEAGKAIDAQWMPLVKSPKAMADTLRREIEVYQTHKLREQRRLEAERQAGEEAVPPPPVADKVKGSYGRAASVTTELVVTTITDQDALYGALRDHPDLKACLLNLAQRGVRAGHSLPGITVEERAKIS
jgi:hypothetical protein